MVKERKYKYLFWGLISILFVFVLGVQFAYSQFATTTPSSGSAWHSASSVVCDNCIAAGNIGDGAVGGGEIANGAITDGDVNDYANIHTRKLNGGNGLHFETGPLSQNVWTIASATTNTVLSNLDGAVVEISCDPFVAGTPGMPTANYGNIRIAGGFQSSNYYKWNHRVIVLDQSVAQEVYLASSAYVAEGATPSTNFHRLQVRTASPNPAIASNNALQFLRTYNGNPGEPVPTQQDFECHIKVLSLCPGSPASWDETCGPISLIG